MKHYIFLFLLLISSCASARTFNDLYREKNIPLPDENAGKIIVSIDKPVIPQQSEEYKTLPRPVISKETVKQITIFNPPIYKKVTYRYELIDGRAYYTDVNYFPDIVNDNQRTITDNPTTEISKQHETEANIQTQSQDNTQQESSYEYEDDYIETKILRKLKPLNTIVVTRTGDYYHYLSCHELKKYCRPTTIAQAKSENFTPCPICKPPRP